MADRATKWNGRIPVYEVTDGQPAVQWFYFSREKDLAKPTQLDQIGEVTFYGADGVRDPVYCHLLLQNLFGVNAGDRRIRKDIEIVIDLFAVDVDDVRKAKTEDDLGNVHVETALFSKTITLHIGDVEVGATRKSVPGVTEISGGSQRSAVEVEVMRAAPGDSLVHLQFQLPVHDADLDPLKQEAAYDKRVLGWAWVVSDYTKAKYQSTFWGGGFFETHEAGLDITQRDQRLWFLKNPSRGAKGWVLKLVRGHHGLSRKQGVAQNFVADEPADNSLRFSKYLPFKSFAIGTQIGSIGLCTDNKAAYYRDGLLWEHVELKEPLDLLALAGYRTAGGTGGAPPGDCFFYGGRTESHPPLQPDASVGGASYPFTVNELQNSYEEQFLFREGSAAAWINSIETGMVFDQKAVRQPPLPGVVAPASAPFKQGDLAKVTVLSHDVMTDYGEKYSLGPRQMLPGFPLVLNTLDVSDLDLSGLRSISIPDGELKTPQGKLAALIGKGLRFQGAPDRFLSALHSRVTVSGDPQQGHWQAHPYAHRPLMFIYELDQDLKQPEIDFLKAGQNDESKGIQIYFGVPTGEAGDPARFALPVLSDECTKAGKHLVLLYLTTVKEGSLNIRIFENKAIRVVHQGPRLPDYALFTICATETVGTLRTQDGSSSPLEGLLAGNPLIALDSFDPHDVQASEAGRLHHAYDIASAKALAKLVLSFVPTYGSALSTLSETLIGVADSVASGKTITKGKPIQAAGKILKVILVEMVAASVKRKNEALGNWIKAWGGPASDDVAAIGEMLNSVEGELAGLARAYQNAVSPLKRTAGFGQSPDVRDQFVLARLWARGWRLSNDGAALRGAPFGEEVLARFQRREIDLHDTKMPPFGYCFGPQGGLLERDDATLPNSLSPILDDFLQKLAALKSSIPAANTLEEHLRWLADPAKHAHAKLSPNLQAYLQKYAPELRELIRKQVKLTEEDDIVRLAAAVQLWNYLSTTLILCPSCKHEMRMNWGWCPYHPTMGDEGILDLEDVNKNGTWSDEFQKWVADPKHTGFNGKVEPKLSEYLKKVPASSTMRILVHRSEFLVLR